MRDDREACEKEAKEAYIKHTEQCQLDECYEQAEREMEPVFATCHALDTAAAKEACLADAEEKLKALRKERCDPEPTCWEQAQHHYNEGKAVCDTWPDGPAKDGCYEEVQK